MNTPKCEYITPDKYMGNYADFTVCRDAATVKYTYKLDEFDENPGYRCDVHAVEIDTNTNNVKPL